MKLLASIRTGIKIAILLFVIRPFIWYFLGLNRYSRLKVPRQGPFILAPNHNSHLDTVLILGLLPLKVAARTSFVAAGDYFYDIPVFSWFLFTFCGFVPVWRKEAAGAEGARGRPGAVDSMAKVLEEGKTLALFPEGTRGFPEQRAGLKRGVAKLAARFPDLPVYPLYMWGLGKSLPKGEMVFVPLVPQVILGEPVFGKDKSEDAFMEALAKSFEDLETKISKANWVAL